MSDRIGFRLKNDDNISKEQLDEKAEQLGLSRSSFIIKALETLLKFDTEFIQKIDSVAEATGLGFSEVIHGFVVKRLAEIDGKAEVWEEGNLLLDELIKAPEGKVGSSDLYHYLKEGVKKKEEQEKIRLLLEKEHKGEDLTEKERQFLIDNKVGQVYYNSEQYERDQEREKVKKEKRELREKALDEGITEKDKEKYSLLAMKNQQLDMEEEE